LKRRGAVVDGTRLKMTGLAVSSNSFSSKKNLGAVRKKKVGRVKKIGQRLFSISKGLKLKNRIGCSRKRGVKRREGKTFYFLQNARSNEKK